MKRFFTLLLSLALLLICFSAFAQDEVQESAAARYPEPGTKVSFQTEDLDKNQVKSEDLFAGKKVTVINFWQTFCEPCLEKMPELDRLNSEYAGKGVQVIGVVCDAYGDEEKMKTAREISGQYGIRTLVLSRSMLDVLTVEGTPTAYLLDGEGKMLSRPVVGANVDEIVSVIDAYLKDEAADAQAVPAAVSTEKQTWTIRVSDQNGDPIPDVAVSFCSDSACTLVELDEQGIGTFSAPAAVYHITFVDIPDGYNADDVGDLYTGEHSGTISVTLTKE